MMNNLSQKILLLILCVSFTQLTFSQQVEVIGGLKVTQMPENNQEENLVIQNQDGSLGTRSVASLPLPPAAIDSTRNLASDFELAKHLCDCPNLPPFMIKKLLDSGYTKEELVASGIPVQDVIDGQRGGILIDSRDNKSYKTVTIGDQTWMAENLNYGTQVMNGTASTDNSLVEKYCYDDNPANCIELGGLYFWDEMMDYDNIEGTQGVCPVGWHIPTDAEWNILEIELGMPVSQSNITNYRGTDHGSKLAGNATLWNDGVLIQNGTFESSGFNAVSSGFLNGSGGNSQLGETAYYWTSSNFFVRGLDIDNTKVWRSFYQDFGFSIRCIKD